MEATVDPTVPANGAADAAAQAPDPRDYLARARSDPDFAEAEIKKHQSDATKARNELKALAPIKDIVSRLDGGAATAAQLIYEQAAILQHPEVRSIVEHYRRTGTLPTSTTTSRQDASEPDEYQDPVDQLRNEVTMLREQLQSVQGHVQRDRSVIAHTAMQSHLQQVADRHSDYWDIIKPALMEQADSWERTPQGRDLLSGSTVDTWDNIAKIAIANNLDAVTARRAERRVQMQSGLGTEPSPSTVTSGRETPILRDERHKPGAARKLIEGIHRREGRLV